MPIREYEHHDLVKFGEYVNKETGELYVYSGTVVDEENKETVFHFYKLYEFNAGLFLPMSDFDDDLDSHFNFTYEHTGVIHPFYDDAFFMYVMLCGQIVQEKYTFKMFYLDFVKVLVPILESNSGISVGEMVTIMKPIIKKGLKKV